MSAQEIAVKVERPERQVLEKLNELSDLGLVRHDGHRWISCIPLYTEDELRIAEQVGEKYAVEQARILQSEIPRLKSAFHQTLLSTHFSWDDVSLIVVGVFRGVTESDLEVVGGHSFNCSPLRIQWPVELEVADPKLSGIHSLG